MNNMIRDLVLGWLQSLASQVLDILGWGGIVALVAGILLVLSLSAKLLKLFSSKLGMVLVAMVMVVGLYFSGLSWPGDDAATLEDAADGPIQAKRFKPVADAIGMADVMTVPTLPPVGVLPGAFAPPIVAPMAPVGITAPLVIHAPHGPILHHQAPPHHHATASITPAAVAPRHATTTLTVKPHSESVAASTTPAATDKVHHPPAAPANTPSHPAVTHHAGGSGSKPAAGTPTHTAVAASATTHKLSNTPALPPSRLHVMKGLSHLFGTVQRLGGETAHAPASPPAEKTHHREAGTGNGHDANAMTHLPAPPAVGQSHRLVPSLPQRSMAAESLGRGVGDHHGGAFSPPHATPSTAHASAPTARPSSNSYLTDDDLNDIGRHLAGVMATRHPPASLLQRPMTTQQPGRALVGIHSGAVLPLHVTPSPAHTPSPTARPSSSGHLAGNAMGEAAQLSPVSLAVRRMAAELERKQQLSQRPIATQHPGQALVGSHGGSVPPLHATPSPAHTPSPTARPSSNDQTWTAADHEALMRHTADTERRLLRPSRSSGSYGHDLTGSAGGYAPSSHGGSVGHSNIGQGSTHLGHTAAMTNRQMIHQRNQMANHMMNQWMGQQFQSMGMGHVGGMQMGGHPAAGGVHHMGGMHHMGGHN